MSTPLELEDIQSGVLSPRPSPYVATYILFRIDDRKVGREMMQKLSTVVASVRDETSPAGDAWVSVSLTFQGLKALGVPQESLDSFPPEFRVGMAARAHELGDTGESSPEKWEKPLGTKDVHVVLTALSPNEQKLESGTWSVRRKHTRNCRVSKLSGVRIASHRLLGRSLLDLETGSVIRQ